MSIDRSSIIQNSSFSEEVQIYRNCRVIDSKLGKQVIIGDSSVIVDSVIHDHVQINRDSMVRSSRIGDYSYTGMRFTGIHCDIGRYNSISWNVTIGGANHDYHKVTTHSFLYNTSFGMLDGKKPLYDRFLNNCIIENDVWIGAGAQILRGVRVGDGAVIAAGSIVTKDVEPYAIVVGVPAQKIKMRFSDEIIERLEKIKWWEFSSDMIKENVRLFNCEPTDEILFQLETIQKHKR